jgi:hypothetical protein
MKLSVNYSKLTPHRVLALMKQGLKIEFPSGYYLKGDLSSGYICLGHQFGEDGLWDMTLEGAKNAINDAKEYERDMKA